MFLELPKAVLMLRSSQTLMLFVSLQSLASLFNLSVT